jgi:Flp pilus assembly protein TadD
MRRNPRKEESTEGTEKGKLDEAIATFEKAKALAPGEPEVVEALARAVNLRGQAR